MISDLAKNNGAIDVPYIKYITFYTLNKTYIWLGIIIIVFMAFTFFLLFSVYLRLMAHKNNISAPFSSTEYDPLPVTNHLIELYWNVPEPFESRTPSKRKETENSLLATIWENMVFVPNLFLKMADKMRKATMDINDKLTDRINPEYTRFTTGLNRVANSIQ